MALKTRVDDVNKTVGEMKVLIAQRESKDATLYEKVDKIYECLIGSTEPEKPSVIVRLDRVEQLMALVKWVSGAVALLILNAIFEWIRGRG